MYREYLTGFHKRKLERQKKAQEFQKEQARLAKIEERKQMKIEREKQLAEQMREYKESMKLMNPDMEDGNMSSEDEDEKGKDANEEAENEAEDDKGEEWEGFADDSDVSVTKGILKRKEVYSTGDADDQEETEVIIEDFQMNNSIEEIAKLNNVNLAKSKKILDESIERAKKYAKLALQEKKPKKKKFRYLTKGARRENNMKAIANKKRSRVRDQINETCIL